MPGSVASSGSLSSPSPSPPPGIGRSLSQPTTGGTGAGLDSDSELSELTEDEQEVDSKNVQIMQEDSQEDDGPRRRPTRRGGRKKRGGMVPAPMWDWAYKVKKNGESGTNGAQEEEEEDDMVGPPTAMEEEEDEDGASITQSLNGNRNQDEDDDDDEAPEDHPGNGRRTSKSLQHANIAGDSNPEDNDPYHKSSGRSAYTHNRRAITPPNPSTQDDPDGSSRSDDEEVDDDDPRPKRPAIASADASDGEEELKGDEDDDGTESEGENPEPDNDGDVDMLPVVSSAKSGPSATCMDVTAPPAAAVGSIVAAAAASSIMAGSSVLDPPSPTPSSSESSSPSSSRSPSPTPTEQPTKGRSDTGRKRKNARAKDPASTTKERRVSDALNAMNGAPKAAPLEPDPEADRDDAVDEADPDQELEMDLELESDLQPAHRAEALDVLATIELKFALLRERVYVEKMESLAWEEMLVSESTHPELIHLQAELSKRRDKRLELASRKRDHETATVKKRRRMDESAVWSWWKFSRDELQIELIAETNRKRRKLERERRAIERPQPVRRIPPFIREISAPPTLRQLVRSFPVPHDHASLLSKRQEASMSPDPELFTVPDLTTLAAVEVAHDLDYLYHNRRAPIDMTRIPSLNHAANLSINAPFGPPISTNLGFDSFASNGASVDGVSGVASYAAYPSSSRMPPPPVFQQSQFLDQPSGPGYHVHTGPSGSRQQHHQLPVHNNSHSPQPYDRDALMPGLGPGLPLSQPAMQQQPPYIGLGNHAYPTQMHISISRPISPVHISSNGPGMSGPAAATGVHNPMSSWPNSGRIPNMHQEPKSVVGNDWPEGRRREMRVVEESGRDREYQVAKERDREKEKFRERGEKDHGHEQHEFDHEQERDRAYNAQQMKQQSHRHPPMHAHQHVHSGGLSHHHHHRHHHHVVHHHHPQQSTSGVNGTGSHLTGPAGLSSPRLHHRDFEPGQTLSGPPLNSSHTPSATASPHIKSHRPISPMAKLGIPTAPRYSPHLSGPGQATALPAYDVGSRTASPLVSFSPSTHLAPRSLQNPTGPTLPPPKMNAIQIADGS